jgi:hypothetical protein
MFDTVVVDQLRFSVRPGAAGGYGVHDSVVDDWCTPTVFVEAAAAELADGLNAWQRAPDHHIDEVRCVSPTAVQCVSWAPAGEIDVWIYDTNSTPAQWLARVRDPKGRVSWVPGEELRPAVTD